MRIESTLKHTSMLIECTSLCSHPQRRFVVHWDAVSAFLRAKGWLDSHGSCESLDWLESFLTHTNVFHSALLFEVIILRLKNASRDWKRPTGRKPRSWGLRLIVVWLLKVSCPRIWAESLGQTSLIRLRFSKILVELSNWRWNWSSVADEWKICIA